MANELLSVPAAGMSFAVAGFAISCICRKASKVILTEKIALMGVLGAFIFAAQMVNFPLPAMPGTSSHVVGAVLAAIILGPHLGAIVMTSVLIIQCLIFQDGGLLSLGCNVINMAIVPTYIGYYLYRLLTLGSAGRFRLYIGTIITCVIAVEAGAVLVPIEVYSAGILSIRISTFMITMLGVHLLVGIFEGLATAAVLGYLQQVRPDILADLVPGKIRLSKKAVLITAIALTIFVGGILSLIASDKPDGLEWSYSKRSDQSKFISQKDGVIASIDKFQSRFSPMPDYSLPGGDKQSAAGWTSLAGISGAGITMVLIWSVARLLRRKAQTRPG